jgi:hypothetical protein
LCFVPANHTTDAKLPAVSGSSGRLVVEREAAKSVEPAYPGQVFAEQERPYAEVMQAFVRASQIQGSEQAPAAPRDAAPTAEPPPTTRALRQEQAELRTHRRQVRARRKQEDAAWRTLRMQRRAQVAGRAPRKRATQAAQTARWRALRDQRRQQRAEREREDAAWRAQRQALREWLEGCAVSTAWIAILVITDNCTRQCLGLPLFVAGARVTAEMVVSALRGLLPNELQFLITDRGVHFTAQVFAQLAREADFVHVVIARHRPQSNCIA